MSTVVTHLSPAVSALLTSLASGRADHPRMVVDDSAIGRIEAAIFWPGSQPPLGQVCRTFEHLGLTTVEQDDITAQVPPLPGVVHLFTLTAEVPLSRPLLTNLCDAFTAQTLHDFVIDDYAALIGTAGLSWRDVVLVRAASRFLRQTGLNFSDSYIVATLSDHPEFVGLLVRYFHVRFDPDVCEREASTQRHHELITAQIDAAETLDDDRILRAFASFVSAMLRTNWFQTETDGSPKSYASFKFDSRLLSLTTAVTPFREIFVDSNDVEGIHVRSAAVARGGLRFSDRTEDYRTEVLGLMKTQTVKNAPIVPSGAKGAFIRRSPQVAPAAAYETFIRGLLDLIDNRTESGWDRPPRSVAYDDQDSYLVVAADKGTARFSDLANSIACERGYWLGDAFASGGSTGYDHKAMGITARGAWLSVRRHLEGMGIDVDQQPVSVIGVGDMSGDVFGNGMLLSSQLRLIAAFDHRHIFVDPDPDAARSLAAREALFRMPASTWADYDPAALSPGAGIWPRTAKSITLSPQVQQRLDIETPTVTPTELIKSILGARADLLWNGGIGTYVKSSAESHSEAADPTNDALRIDACALRAKVIGEGGNLGLTQRARIEYALAGGRINADFIDNAAGVATSDLEVNLKIALDTAARRGAVSADVRNALLAGITGDVADIVLHQCDNQLLAIGLAESHAARLLNRHERLIATLEQNNGIDRTANALPSTKDLMARVREGRGLTRPEIAVLLAHSKNIVRDELLASHVPDDPVFHAELARYFPERLRSALGDVGSHPLEREIVATTVADYLINHLGPGLIYQLEERLDVRSPAVAAAYAVVRDLFDIDREWSLARNRPAGGARTRWDDLHSLQRFIEQSAAWILRRHGESFDISDLIDRYRSHVPSLRTRPDWPLLRSAAFDLMEAADRCATDVEVVAELHLRIDEILGLSRAIAEFDRQVLTDWWDAMAGAAVRDELSDSRHALTMALLTGDTDAATVAEWASDCAPQIERFIAITNRLHGDGRYDASRAMTLHAELRLLVQHTPRRLSPST